MRFLTILATAGVLAVGCHEQPKTPLTRAAFEGRADEVRALLATVVSARSAEAHAALTLAARRGRVAVVDALLDAGADVNRRDGEGNHWTPLVHALHKDQTGVARRLIERGADPRLPTTGGATPLLMAAGNGNAEAVRLLLAHGADPRQEHGPGVTPLALAVAGGAFSDIDRPILGRCADETVKALIEKAPDLRLADTFYPRMALGFARLNGCKETLRLVDTPAQAVHR